MMIMTSACKSPREPYTGHIIQDIICIDMSMTVDVSIGIGTSIAKHAAHVEQNFVPRTSLPPQSAAKHPAKSLVCGPPHVLVALVAALTCSDFSY